MQQAIVYDSRNCTLSINNKAIPYDGIVNVNFGDEQPPYGTINTLGGVRKFKASPNTKEVSFEITNDSDSFRWFKYLETALKIQDNFNTTLTFFDGCQTDYTFVNCSYGGSSTGQVRDGEMPTTTFTFSAEVRKDSVRGANPW